MIKEIQVTLYEIFGYLVPGAVLTSSLAIGFYAILFPKHELQFDLPTVETWLTFLTFSYINGHMAQAIGNILLKLRKWSEDDEFKALPLELRDAVLVKVRRLMGNSMGKLSGRWIYDICDDMIIRSGRLGEREIFTYREGFYRGILVGFTTLTFALIGLAIRLHSESPPSLTLGSWVIIPKHIWFSAIVSATWACLSYRRYWRFMAYRLKHAVLGFLSLIVHSKDGDVLKDTTNE